MGVRRPMSAETKRKISESKKGKPFSQLHRDRIAESLRGNRNAEGHTVSEEEKLKISELKTTHGLSQGEHYQRWYDMMSRCYNSSDPVFKWYGARGIIVCEEWHDIRNFVRDLELLPIRRPGESLDRIDNNGNYEPSNVRWSTQQEQVRNSRRYNSDI